MTDVAPVVTIDGPSGSGKGTVARQISQAMGWHFLDSGAIYRVLGLAAERRSLSADRDQAAIIDLARTLPVAFGGEDEEQVWLEGEDVSQAIRTEYCGNLASQVAAIVEVREALLERQRAFRQPPGLVADGRDMGTVVFPDAPVKIFLTASAEERARRRHKQLKEQGVGVTLSALLREIAERDERDAARPVSPLKPAEDAELVDTTELDVDAVIKKVLSVVQNRLGD